MREFELVIDEAFKNGLSPVSVVPFNTQVLYECVGFRCGKAGLTGVELGDNRLPLAIDIFYNWPFPQVIMGERYNFLVIRDTVFGLQDYIYLVSDDLLTVTLLHSSAHGSLLEAADFGEYAFLTNGVVMIYWNPTLAVWTEIVASATIPMMKTVCNFKGKAVGGNVVSAWYDCDETSYVWSKIGSMDFTPDMTNESGYRRCPYGGEVYHVRRLDDNVIGYSSKGITMLVPVGNPAATFGFKELCDVGVVNKGAMNGNLKRHIFVGEDYSIREVTSEGVKELGYKYYMKQLNSEDIIVTYDKSKGDFYIGNSTKTFLLSPNGLTEINQHPSAVWRAYADSENLGMVPDTVDSIQPVITTEAFDMGYKGQKTTATVETDAMICEGAEATIDWANDLTSWGSGQFTPINDMGIATKAAAGNAFRFRLRFSKVYEVFRMGYMKVRYKMTDLRGIRGVYAPAPRGQA